MLNRALGLEIENNRIEVVHIKLDYISKNGYWFGSQEFDME